MKQLPYTVLWRFIVCLSILGLTNVSFWSGGWSGGWSGWSGWSSGGSSSSASQSSSSLGSDSSSSSSTVGDSGRGRGSSSSSSRVEDTTFDRHGNQTGLDNTIRTVTGTVRLPETEIHNWFDDASGALDHSGAFEHSGALDHAGRFEDRPLTTASWVLDPHWQSSRRNGTLRNRDVVAINGVIDRIPDDRKLDFLQQVSTRIEGRKNAIRTRSGNRPLSQKSEQNLKKLEDIQALIQDRAAAISNPVQQSVQNAANITDNGTVTDAAGKPMFQEWFCHEAFCAATPITVTGLVMMKTSDDTFVISEGGRQFTVQTNAFLPGWAKIVNLLGHQVPVQFIQVANFVTVTGMVDGTIIHATQVIVQTNKDGA